MLTTPYPLGRKVNHDPRSRSFAFPAEVGTLVSARHARRVPVFDQGQLGSCTGNAAVGCIATDPFFETLPGGLALDETAAIEVYSEATVLDPFPGAYPPDDTGSDGLSVAKVLKTKGLISGYQHAFGIDAALAAPSHQPVIVGTNWYPSMFYPDSRGIISIGSTEAPTGGHEYVLDEVDFEARLVGGTNSWGDGWGLLGRFYMTFETFGRLLAERGDVTVFVALDRPAPTPVPPEPVVDLDKGLWDALCEWAKARHSRSNRKAAKAVLEWAEKKGFHP